MRPSLTPIVRDAAESGPAWVAVADESSHVEVFRNDVFRAYVADLSPGQETEYHRHAEDTLYLVLEGGGSTTRRHPLSPNVSYTFPRSVGLCRKLRWALATVLRRPIELEAEVALYMKNRDRPAIHRVKAAEGNRAHMRLMGIEALGPRVHAPIRKRRTPFGELDLADDAFSLYRFDVREGSGTRGIDPNFCGLVVWFQPGKRGEFLWHGPGEPLDLLRGAREARGVIIVPSS
jgi:hypothetical protein